MLFNSYTFLLFFPIVTIGYYILPHRIRWVWLLIASYYFYMSWNPIYGFLLFFCTLVTYICGMLVSSYESVVLRKLLLISGVVTNIGILIYFKYVNFISVSVFKVMSRIGIDCPLRLFDIVLPVGISFFTFQALGYLIDVYRGDINVERNFFKYALFVSFFPQLVAGPIERSGNLLRQIQEEHKFDIDNVRRGFELMLFGYFQKMVIADRAGMFVDHIYNNYEGYAFVEIVLATIVFAIQIYCDFGGYSNIAIGAAQVMGFDLMKNFKQPFLALSVKDLWKRWHISLTTWFRDYIYIPLGGSRKGKIRSNINILIVFALSGLWHGAAWNYVLWGLLNGIMQVVEDIVVPLRRKIESALGIRSDCFSYKLYAVIKTFVLFNISLVFFRASSDISVVGVFKQMFSSFNPWVLVDTSLYKCGLDRINWFVLFIAVLILLAVDIMHEMKINIRETLECQNLLFHVLTVFGAIMIVLVFGVYGPTIDAEKFIYFTF